MIDKITIKSSTTIKYSIHLYRELDDDDIIDIESAVYLYKILIIFIIEGLSLHLYREDWVQGRLLA